MPRGTMSPTRFCSSRRLIGAKCYFSYRQYKAHLLRFPHPKRASRSLRETGSGATQAGVIFCASPKSLAVRSCRIFFPDDLSAFASIQAKDQAPANIQDRVCKTDVAFAFGTMRRRGWNQSLVRFAFKAIFHCQFHCKHPVSPNQDHQHGDASAQRNYIC
jgi:hypothetical protein